MNLCLVSHEYPPESARGGIGTQTFNKARTFARLGHSVHVLSCAAKQASGLRTEAVEGVLIHRMQPPGFEFPVYNTPTYWLGHSWSVLRELNGLMQTTKFDVVDFPEYGAEGFAFLLDRTPENWVAVVVQLYGPLAMFSERIGWPEKDSEFHRVGTCMEGVCVRQADALTACSANIADFTEQYYGATPGSIDVVYCDVDTDRFSPMEKPYANGRPTVLFVGNISCNKGVHTVFDAVMRLRPKYPGIRLQVLGKCEDDLADNLRSRAHTMGAGENVEFHGFVDRNRIPEFYRKAQVFASPAQHEPGVANVYLEAMASGCPVLASASGGAPEAVRHGETGLLVSFGNVDETTAALDRLLGDSALRNRMGQEGRRRAVEVFAMEKCAERIMATYKKAIKRSNEKLRLLQS